ncbi:DegT/DnrJ/EryC1/StrS family aminotransferase [Halomonas beimenensis]|uniref:4-keto-6-deoxy-N-Acetyl-D-hexosaminyl-(Lipid carrier) aminotransferase n=1 Tax=Halomonas beimenensis TaxID=475662 RepID=A0A291P8C7_9GAMM|nr:DegT/DnrJ/EryC1/StrS aminotransferase family protein [Halomonas beimenensis]ATJ83134.1 4-keto-6-deoxy-N-Acetyl-D-hexosaminyl-(Lipid carrier) aminotransferase [Halomonas beimenensis]
MPAPSFSPWPSFGDEEVGAVERVLRSNRVNYWTGEECRHFEFEFADFVGVEYAIAVCNGTVALELALKGLGIGSGDEVIVTARSFMASTSCIVAVGAVPVFADVDPASQNVTAATMAPLITSRTRAVISVHLAGWPCEMDGIVELAERHGLYVIEDCAQAHGAMFRGRSVGGIGHVGCWSFCQDKIMTTGGEGGMVTTSDEALWRRMWAYKDHGKSWEAVHATTEDTGFKWLHESFGSNLRMTEMQAAIGRIQLRRLSAWRARRRANATRIWDTAADCPGLRAPVPPSHLTHAAYKCYVFVEPSRLRRGWDRERIRRAINDRGVPCLVGSCAEIYREKAFDGTGWRPLTPLPVARALGETSLMFLCHPTLTEDEVLRSCEVLRDVMGEAGER